MSAQRHRSHGRWHASLDLIVRSLLEILIIAIFVATFIAQPVRVPTQSMEPTLRAGDFALADKQSFAPEGWLGKWMLPSTNVERGDLAVFRFPPDPSRSLVKRVVGLPGDRVRLHDGRLFVNDAPLLESYATHSTAQTDPYRDDFPFLRSLDADVEPQWWVKMRDSVHGGEIAVPADQYFVLGDNRDSSEDSRYWGFVPREDFIGRPLFVYLPAPAHDLRTTLRAIRIAR